MAIDLAYEVHSITMSNGGVSGEAEGMQTKIGGQSHMPNITNAKIVIPMAGKGQRFEDAGYELPKPLIDVNGFPMVYWAVKSLPLIPYENMIFIVQTNHIHQFSIDIKLRELFSSNIVVLPQNMPPEGQAGSVMLAQSEIDNDHHLIIYNCDTFAPNVGNILLREIEAHPDVDGFIPVFDSSEPNLSYVRTASSGNIIEVAEKRVISREATIGLYHFRKGKYFVSAVKKMISENFRINNEFYVLPTYQYLINTGKLFRSLFTDTVHILGTPNELQAYIEQSKRTRAP